ncbi:hypothetical protein FRACYDRAFT_240798 [Fragilariopsis cylindrus CCMP1102]|uniref:Uncharacterized protein n=1 Tax=Fragilariopsis cylindrus CCMP1102 TaxID=635003 RepID=A0A1E7F827_9STRA|nr:hypothetical protein FRACYDRAFT_240798 [Fragilariopsis cylindrus CCMP1102]|eukprot:OEU14264.1 hypothetical protein FRACYDRAFT_240798 [Fragilariopsis cylindrus CCMP1102]
MTEIELDNNKKETKSLFKTALATILEDAIYIDTVADVGATGHFSQNKGNKLNNNSMDVVVAALEIPPNNEEIALAAPTPRVLETAVAAPRLLVNHEDPEVGRKWHLSSTNEFGRTIQGVGNTRVEEDKVKGTATMHLIKKCDIPRNKKITYAQFYKYMQIHRNLIPEEIKLEYNTAEFTDQDGYVYMEVTGAIYGLSQSRYLANQDLIKNLAIFGYHPVKRTPGLWKHETRRTAFILVVDDFGVQYFRKEDANHFINPVRTD